VSLEARTFQDIGGTMRQRAVCATVPARDQALVSGMGSGINDSMDRRGESLLQQTASH
jgi:hypothetical protein